MGDWSSDCGSWSPRGGSWSGSCDDDGGSWSSRDATSRSFANNIAEELGGSDGIDEQEFENGANEYGISEDTSFTTNLGFGKLTDWISDVFGFGNRDSEDAATALVEDKGVETGADLKDSFGSYANRSGNIDGRGLWNAARDLADIARIG